MKLSVCRALLVGLFGVGMLLLLIALAWGDDDGAFMLAFGIAGFVVWGAAVVVGLIFWRCPHCDRLLHSDMIVSTTRYCPFCGNELYVE